MIIMMIRLNKLLQGDPSPSELRYALKTRYRLTITVNVDADEM